MATTIIAIVITIIFSGFFSGMEIAFVSSDKLRFEVDQRKGVISNIIGLFYRNTNDFISTMLVGNNVVLVVYGILMSEVIVSILSRTGIVIESESLLLLIQTIISTLIILFTGEYLPKTIFRINPNDTLRVFAIPAFLCFVALYPVSKFATLLSRLFLKLLGRDSHHAHEGLFTRNDLDNLIQTSIDNADDEDETSQEELKIFQNALDFSDTRLRDCLVPRTEIEAVAYDCPASELIGRFIETGKTKLLVYKENIDNIVGYIHSSEMFRHSSVWPDYIRETPFVPETMTAHKMLQTFMQQKKSIAVVVDEFGGTAGIVTIEDLLEEIFGEIEDEHDRSNYIAKETAPGEYVLSARMEIDKVNELFSIELPEDSEYLTIGGLILSQYQSFPKVNELITIGKFQFRILKISATKIELVKLIVKEDK